MVLPFCVMAIPLLTVAKVDSVVIIMYTIVIFVICWVVVILIVVMVFIFLVAVTRSRWK